MHGCASQSSRAIEASAEVVASNRQAHPDEVCETGECLDDPCAAARSSAIAALSTSPKSTLHLRRFEIHLSRPSLDGISSTTAINASARSRWPSEHQALRLVGDCRYVLRHCRREPAKVDLRLTPLLEQHPSALLATSRTPARFRRVIPAYRWWPSRSLLGSTRSRSPSAIESSRPSCSASHIAIVASAISRWLEVRLGPKRVLGESDRGIFEPTETKDRRGIQQGWLQPVGRLRASRAWLDAQERTLARSKFPARQFKPRSRGSMLPVDRDYRRIRPGTVWLARIDLTRNTESIAPSTTLCRCVWVARLA